jgi:hypothetical protein
MSFLQEDLRGHLGGKSLVRGVPETRPGGCVVVVDFKMGIRGAEGLQKRKKRVGICDLVQSGENHPSKHKN